MCGAGEGAQALRILSGWADYFDRSFEIAANLPPRTKEQMKNEIGNYGHNYLRLEADKS